MRKQEADELRLLIGWAVTSTIDGEEHVDTQGDIIPEDVVLRSALEWAADSDRAAHVNHEGEQVGIVALVMPLIGLVQTALDLAGPVTGLAVGIRIAATPAGDKVLQQVADGDLTGFSIGGVIPDAGDGPSGAEETT